MIVLATTALLFGSACANNSDSRVPSSAASSSIIPPVARAGSVSITGAVAAPRQITVADLRNYPAKTQAVTFASSKGDQSHTYVGASIIDVLAAAEPVTDSAVKNPTLRLVVVATGADEYRAALSWGEFDPGFAATPVLIAYREDDIDLTAPRLVVPGDIKGGRYVSDLTSLTVIDTGAAR
ncbi:molybdopterin-binding oxidoreductase [Nocardia sp. NPDC051833]|uniref:molybdopterin-binding oxidoreductase n=1 Tax=Nocardia sp. NPDC051833 TaxID=3155674 RepID=UPI0034185147